MGKSATQIYKLKATTGKFNTHTEKYTHEQLQFIQETLSDQLYYFGYANVEGNPVGFFEFQEHSSDNLAKFEKFKTDSQEALKYVTTEGHVKKTYIHNDSTMELFDSQQLQRLL